MSLPDPPPSSKYRHLWVIVPFGLLGLLIVVWSAAWVWARGETARRIDAYQAAWDSAGYRLTWKDRRIGGYPFRMDVTLTDVAVREPAGWALEAPRIEGEAFMHALTHWIVAAPAGITFVRPLGGPVAVKGELIRASVSHFENRPPNFDVEGVKLTFAPAPGAQPFALVSAARAEFHLRQGPNDEGGVFVMLEGGRARSGGLLARLAGDKPIAMQWKSTFSKASAFSGANWPQAVRAWTAAGGKLSVRNAGLTAGEPIAGVSGGTISVEPDGRASGGLTLTLTHPGRAFDALAAEAIIDPGVAQSANDVARARQGPGDTAQAELGFQAGRTTFGPVSLGPAPKVYDPR